MAPNNTLLMFPRSLLNLSAILLNASDSVVRMQVKSQSFVSMRHEYGSDRGEEGANEEEGGREGKRGQVKGRVRGRE